MPYWVKFESTVQAGGCVAGVQSKEEAAAKALEVTGFKPVSVETLPYGSAPVIWAPEKALHGFFCMHPNKCAGHTSCPRNYACSE